MENTALGFSFIAVAIGPSDAAQCGPMISWLRRPIAWTPACSSARRFHSPESSPNPSDS
jgi:hypothetical protein